MEKPIAGLEYLLMLHGEIFRMDNGYWTKIEAWMTSTTEQVPHGIRYSLTLHDHNNDRVLGYDNAHHIKPKLKQFAVEKTTWDHKHLKNKVKQYEFESAYQLLEDFWKEVDSYLKEVVR
jgi:hypothetical protein